MTQKILIVECDASLRDSMRTALERRGYDITLAASFREGKRALADQAFDLMIADMRLGEFNGLQLLITSERAIPAIVVTSFPDPVLAEEVRKLGAAYITTPFQASSLAVLAAEKLTATVAPEGFAKPRRWIRKSVAGNVTARVQNASARILDISYGGLRLDVQPSEDDIPASFSVIVPPSDVSVRVDLVWKNRTEDGHWLCGAALADASQSLTRAWCSVVDAIA